jgi:hypothetical protein
LSLAGLCTLKKRHAAAARFYADAFTDEPKLAADLRQQYRYNAACSAALAATGRGEDAKNLPDKVVIMFRRQALAWLRADLAAYTKFVEGNNAASKQAVRQRLEHWQQAPDLVGVRDKKALAELPAAERAEWGKLWAEVADLLRRLDAGKPAAAPAGK